MSVTGTPLTPDLAAQVEPLLAARRRRLGHDCLSELAYSNFLLFRDAHRYRYVDGALPHIAGITYDGERHVTPLFDPADASGEALHALLADGACLYPVAATELAHFDAGTFTWDATISMGRTSSATTRDRTFAPSAKPPDACTRHTC